MLRATRGERGIRWLAVLALLVFATTPAPGAPAPRFQLKSATVYPQIPLSNTDLATRYDLVIFQLTAVSPDGYDANGNYIGDPQRIAKLKALNPNVKVLLYWFPQIAWNWQYGWGDIAKHEDWFIHGAGASRTVNPNDKPQHLMNIDNSAYRRYIINFLVSNVNRYGFEGIFNDGIWPTVNLGQEYVGWSPRPPRDAIVNWHAWSLRLLRELKQALGPSRLLITSSTTVSDDGNPLNRDDDFLRVVDGTMIEGYLHAPWDSPTQIPGGDWWTFQQAMFKRNVDAGKYFIGLSGMGGPYSPDQARRWQFFTFGSYLLRADGKRSYYQWHDGDYFNALDAAIGTPLGDPYSRDGVWQRDFANGKVIVNVSEADRTITLPNPFRSLYPDRSGPISSVTLGRATAAILVK